MMCIGDITKIEVAVIGQVDRGCFGGCGGHVNQNGIFIRECVFDVDKDFPCNEIRKMQSWKFMVSKIRCDSQFHSFGTVHSVQNHFIC